MALRESTIVSATVVALLTLLVGCGTKSTSATAAEVFPRTASILDSYPAALLKGTLSIDTGDDNYCPRVETSEGDNYLLVLPPTAELTSESIRAFDQTISTGEVTLGGGVIGIDFNDAGCASSSEAWLVGP